MKEKDNQNNKEFKEVETPKDYYSNPVVSRAILEFLGCTDLPESPSLLAGGDFLGKASAEYLAVVNLAIRLEKSGKVPVRSIKPQELPSILGKDPATEIFQSLWQKDAPGQEDLPLEERKPIRSLFVLDIEYYNKKFPGKAFVDQLGTFQLLEPAYQTVREILLSYGINHLAVMTGRGYHFISQIPFGSSVLDELIELGNLIEPPVAKFQKVVPARSKRDRPIPPKSELAYKGLSYLAHFIFTRSIRNARKRSQIPVEVSDLGEEGIAFDATTTMVRHVGSAKIGVPGSIYVKPLIATEVIGEEIVRRTRLLTRVVRAVGDRELGSIEELIQARQNYKLALFNLEKSGGEIPDGSVGIAMLIEDYERSGLRKLHKAIDEEQGDPQEIWHRTYRNYSGIIEKNPDLAFIINKANPKLLEPDSLNYLIDTLFDRWGGRENIRIAGHVRTFLRAVYEDPKFHWGERFTRHESATRHASGWTAIILGKRFESENL